jgi:hypothetical protein
VNASAIDAIVATKEWGMQWGTKLSSKHRVTNFTTQVSADEKIQRNIPSRDVSGFESSSRFQKQIRVVKYQSSIAEMRLADIHTTSDVPGLGLRVILSPAV